MARYKYIQRNHAIVIPATQVPATTKTANPWLTSTTTSGTTTTEVETTTPAPTSQTTRVETLYEFLARIENTVVKWFINEADEVYAVIVDSNS